MAGQRNELLWDRWDEVDRIYGQALGLAVEERHPFLVEVCAGDTELLDTVSRLLLSSDQAADVLVGPGTELLRAALTRGDDAEVWTALAPGTSVGRYRLVREIGRGGMATVYAAERADGAFERRVAVKILRGVDSEELGRRFVTERQILSSLSHPNIARLLDGGSMETGRPFLVMELVEGEPITSWADRRRMGIGERLRLFLQVVDAVQYAHGRLVVHRDIKPSNVLVDADGHARLLDFGIAKLLEESVDEASHTRPATRWMTPEYAAPEQILSRAVTTATDVHALGVLLYELLTGRRPFGGDGRVGFDLERAICEEPPIAPSSAISATVAGRAGRGRASTPEDVAAARGSTTARLARTLAGDLDAILSKCLRKQPEDRYRSAQELRDDIGRHLTGFPVRAREGLRAYRARKFLGRHRLAVSAAATVGVVLLGSAALLARLQAETAVQRDLAAEAAARAETEAENARLVIDFMADVFRGRDPNQAPPDTITARELLAWGTERVEAEFSDRPAVQADLMLVLGDAHFNLGQFDEGMRLAEHAVELLRSTFGSRSPEVAEGLGRLGDLQRQARELSLAEASYSEALDILLDAGGGQDRHRSTYALQGLGMTLAAEQRPDSAEVLLRRALALGPHDPHDAAYVGRLLGLAYVLRHAGKLAESEALYEEGIPAYRRLSERRDGQLAIHLNNLAYLHRVKGDWDDAVELYREALEISAPLYGRGHPNTLLVANNLAGALQEMGRDDEVVAVLAESAEAAEKQWPNGHWRAAVARGAVGDALLRQGRLDEAEPYLRAEATYLERELGPLHDWTSFAYARIAVIDLLRGDTARGRAFLDRLHAYLGGHELTADNVGQLVTFLYVLGDTGPAEQYRRFRALHPDSAAADARSGG